MSRAVRLFPFAAVVALTAAIIFWSTGPITGVSADTFTPNPATICNNQTTSISGTIATSIAANSTIYFTATNGGTVSPATTIASTGSPISFQYTAPATGQGTATINIGTAANANNLGT